jgi:hypothetical protein
MVAPCSYRSVSTRRIVRDHGPILVLHTTTLSACSTPRAISAPESLFHNDLVSQPHAGVFFKDLGTSSSKTNVLTGTSHTLHHTLATFPSYLTEKVRRLWQIVHCGGRGFPNGRVSFWCQRIRSQPRMPGDRRWNGGRGPLPRKRDWEVSMEHHPHKYSPRGLRGSQAQYSLLKTEL